MTAESFLDGRVTLHCGDCLEVLAALPPASVDAVVTDPPYHLASIVKRFGGRNAAAALSNGPTGIYARASKGFMGKQWDGGDVAFRPETWAAVLRVLKPGGHLAAFNAPRNVHWMAVAIEEAGFELRDRLLEFVAVDAAAERFLATLTEAQQDAFLRCLEESGFGGELAWVFGSGFPKSHDVSKAIDKIKGAVRERKEAQRRASESSAISASGFGVDGWSPQVDEAVTDEARRWAGWGTALKPAYEPIVLARKPIEADSVAAQVLATGTGSINVGACLVGTEEMPATRSSGEMVSGNVAMAGGNTGRVPAGTRPGRWPANVLHDGSADAVAGFPAEAGGGDGSARLAHGIGGNGTALHGGGRGAMVGTFADSGSAARFFYAAKADAEDRLGSKHPTVKPVDLMQWLVRLVTPRGGLVLDPFAGTGTTAEAAVREGMRAVLIEREDEYQADIRRRMALVLAGPDERAREAIKARQAGKSADAGPLFMEATP